MKIEVHSDEPVQEIASWLSENISPGYAYVPAGTGRMFKGLQYQAFDKKWTLTHYFDYKERFAQYVSVEGLEPEQESMLCLLFS